MCSELFVIRIEKLLEAGVEGFVIGNVRAKNESFEKPGGVRQMPFCGATVRHRLEHLIFGRKRLGYLQASIANFPVLLAKRTPDELLGMAGGHFVLLNRDL